MAVELTIFNKMYEETMNGILKWNKLRSDKCEVVFKGATFKFYYSGINDCMIIMSIINNNEFSFALKEFLISDKNSNKEIINKLYKMADKIF